MKIYTIGYTKKSAEEFFSILKKHLIKQLVDIRENNTSQLSGFTKKEDIKFFVREILNASYIHLPDLAPDRKTRDNYKKVGNWCEYKTGFRKLLKERDIARWLKENRDVFINPFVLLCSEPLSNNCHRRLVAELIKKEILPDGEIIHL